MTAQRAALPDYPAATQNNAATAESVIPDAPVVSVREYLDSEQNADTRHEYVDGVLLAMAGETPDHNRIAGNVYRRLGNHFEDMPCDAFMENIRVRVTPTQYRYPDIAALCGDAEFDTGKPPSLLNPAVLVEVLSPSTADEDRSDKFAEYRRLPSLTDYILIEQDRVQVEHYTRQSASQWLLTIYHRREDVIALPGLNVSLALADIYRKIVFAAPVPPPE